MNFDTISWLISVPAGDCNFKSNVERATIDELIYALSRAKELSRYKSGFKTKIAVLEKSLRAAKRKLKTQNGNVKSTIQLFYSSDNDCLQMVKNGELVYHDEGINSCEFLSYFGANIESIEDLKNLSVEAVIEGYDCIQADFYYHSRDDVKGYFENISKQTIKGDSIFTGII